MTNDRRYRKGSHTAERAAAELRRAVRHGDLIPGEHVRQSFWASRLGVSSASMQQALKILVSEHLLTYDAHRGYFVTRIDRFEMAQVYQVRRVLETEVLNSIRWPSPEELKAIREAMDEVIERLKGGDGHEALEAVRKVSFAMFDLSPLNVIVSETKHYWDRAAVYRALDLASLEDPGAQHISSHYATLIACLEAQDRASLVALNSEHRSQKSTQAFT